MDARLESLLRQMPKAELHMHIEGSLEPEMIFRLAERNHVKLAYGSVEVLRRAYAFTDLQSFLDIYYAGASVLLREDDFFDMGMAYFARAAADHVVHAEIFFDPQTHTARGVAFATVIDGLSRACAQAKAAYGIDASLIMCFLRHLSEEAAFATLEGALPYLDRFIGVGLDSGERPSPFAGRNAAAPALGTSSRTDCARSAASRSRRWTAPRAGKPWSAWTAPAWRWTSARNAWASGSTPGRSPRCSSSCLRRDWPPARSTNTRTTAPRRTGYPRPWSSAGSRCRSCRFRS